MLELVEGNQRFQTQRMMLRKSTVGIREVRLKPHPPKAIVISCARTSIGVHEIFDTSPRRLDSIRILGNVCSPDDGVVNDVEFCESLYGPPVLLVLGNLGNDVIEGAVRKAMVAAGRSDAPKGAGLEDDDAALYDKVFPAARDALSQLPNAPFERLCELTTQLNVWNTIETLVSSSGHLHSRVKMSQLTMQGAIFNPKTGKVQFLGRHPSVDELLRQSVRRDIIRTSERPRVPAEEAYAEMVAGNRRYSMGRGGIQQKDEQLLESLANAGQNPMAVVLGCSDSRCPVETMFDMRPGDIFVMRNAGNTPSARPGSLIGSLEYAVAVLGSNFVVVAGHTKCGAVTGAVQAVIKGETLTSYPGSIDKVLGNIVDVAEKAVKQLPEASLPEKVALATKLNVQTAIERLICFSPIVKEGIASGKLQVRGAVYDIASGEVEWLGEHPDQEELVGAPLALQQWKRTPYSRSMATQPIHGRSTATTRVIQRLEEGNRRFIAGKLEANVSSDSPDEPIAMVIGTADTRISCERLFDVNPGQIIVQRTMGNVAGRQGGCQFASIEYAVKRWNLPALVVLADTDCVSMKTALEQVSGARAVQEAWGVLERLQPAALRASTQVEGEVSEKHSAAGKKRKTMQMAIELNALYTIECLLMHSEVVREAVSQGRLELHAAVMDRGTGQVEFIGEHPMLEALLGRTAAEQGEDDAASSAEPEAETQEAADEPKAETTEATAEAPVVSEPAPADAEPAEVASESEPVAVAPEVSEAEAEDSTEVEPKEEPQPEAETVEAEEKPKAEPVEAAAEAPPASEAVEEPKAEAAEAAAEAPPASEAVEKPKAEPVEAAAEAPPPSEAVEEPKAEPAEAAAEAPAAPEAAPADAKPVEAPTQPEPVAAAEAQDRAEAEPNEEPQPAEDVLAAVAAVASATEARRKLSEAELAESRRRAELLAWAAQKLASEGSPLAATAAARAQEALDAVVDDVINSHNV